MAFQTSIAGAFTFRSSECELALCAENLWSRRAEGITLRSAPRERRIVSANNSFCYVVAHSCLDLCLICARECFVSSMITLSNSVHASPQSQVPPLPNLTTSSRSMTFLYLFQINLHPRQARGYQLIDLATKPYESHLKLHASSSGLSFAKNGKAIEGACDGAVVCRRSVSTNIQGTAAPK